MRVTPLIRHGRPVLLGAGILAACAAFMLSPRSFAQEARPVPAPVMDEPAHGGSETAILAGGCFWGVQGVYQHLKGVSSAVSGYTGGEADTAHYEDVSTGTTGHAESVKITFDPHVISYGQILQVYFSAAHDPTELNYQGPDHGTQYRSAVFPTSDAQAKVAAAYVAQLDGAHTFGAPVVTRIESGHTFYPAEAHHQDFLSRNPTYPYIAINDMPKVAAVKTMYPGLYRSTPVLVAGAAAAD
ncbi:peptide-methionine (S)-S-oxide reductase MsrA [Lichenihabitans sp. Uapishka_5]|uniref:peptide-methionine (S)-S-oxide reductase MsrA n=1 Tax=Lichenihabitans sp. Uapishka_5 TaxID=3037302 RepID=UPI0029E80755|nr:peptide-methionine (S)-S-oxide reductase MsrA [Lichenihabitans sp. Uapishka_5]MDX7950608.1 peptide-methionine (S)-S-oxide reductase MsrA [Lichenihabitans sp. Uapishka_5]